MQAIPSSVPAPVIGAFISSLFAVAVAIYSLSVARRSRKTETTRDLLRKYFGVEFTLARRESLAALEAFWNTAIQGGEVEKDPLILYLVSSQLHERRYSQERMENRLSSQQNVLLLLYFFAELEAYRKRDLLDSELVKELLVSQWETFQGVLTQVVNAYERAANPQKESSPPWAAAIKSFGAWMSDSKPNTSR